MATPEFIVYVLSPLGAYFLGAIPFAFLIGKAHGVDIRKVGSGNIGATNLGRTLGMKYFWPAMLLDAFKGFLPVLLTSLYVAHVNTLGSWTPLLAGVAAMLGHLFPIYLKFRGGKGVSTSFGIVLGLWPLYTLAGLMAGFTFVVIFMACRYISVASMVSAMAFTLYVIILGTQDTPVMGRFLRTPDEQLYPLVYIACAFAALIIIKHRSNIGRLIKGTEPKWGQKRQG